MIAAALALALAAQAGELSAADLHLIEKINQAVNTERYDAGVRDCNSFAVNKLFHLIEGGIPAAQVRLAKVLDEHGHGHAVAEVVGAEHGKPVTIVLDSRFAWTETRQTLEAYGYRWVSEWPQTPTSQPILQQGN